MRIAKLLTIGFCCALSASVAAGELAGVTMQDSIDVNGKHLQLNGMGLREATWLKVNVYVAGLYVERVTSNPAAAASPSQTKRLTLAFVRDVGRSDILKAWHEGFANNATVPLTQIQPQMDQLDRWMTGFSKGDTLSFTFVPGQGTSVEINGARKGILQGEDFARSLFSIWFGPKPPTSAVKRGLLGNHAG